MQCELQGNDLIKYSSQSFLKYSKGMIRKLMEFQSHNLEKNISNAKIRWISRIRDITNISPTQG